MEDNKINQVFLTVEEVAALLRVAEATVYRMVRKGQLPAVKFGKVWRINREKLKEIIGDF